MKRRILASLLCVACLLTVSACDGAKAVPDVKGLSYAEATSKLSQDGFYTYKAQTPDGALATYGTVSKQDPKGGSKASTSDTITLTIENDATKAMEQSKRDDQLKTQATQYKGQNATDVMDQLAKAGTLGTVIIANDMQPGTDRSQQVRDDTTAGVQYVVTDTTVKDGKISLTVDTKSRVDASTAKEQQKTNLEKRLSTSSALAACTAKGKEQYPYGFKFHNIVGVVQDFTPSDDNTWFYKATADITNQYGAKQKDATVECYVTGNTATPQVSAFNVY